MQSAAKLIFGCGYLGARVARLWREAGHPVHVVTRSAGRASELRAAGYSPVVADVTDGASLAGLPSATTVLYAVGYDRTAGPSLRQVYVDGLRSALAALPDSVERVIYISSTSVYGQADGALVDETSVCEPVTENGQVCVDAEQALVASRLGKRSIRLRLAGIYGPGRIPRRAALATGEPIAAPGEGYLNLIHVDDAARIVVAAERLPVPPPRLFTVCDGHPVVRREYYAELARLVGGPPPVFVEPDADAPATSRASTSKRVSNARLMAELGLALEYPNYREGLRAIVTDEGDQGGARK